MFNIDLAYVKLIPNLGRNQITHSPKNNQDAEENRRRIGGNRKIHIIAKDSECAKWRHLTDENVKEFLDAPHIGGNIVGIRRPNISIMLFFPHYIETNTETAKLNYRPPTFF